MALTRYLFENGPEGGAMTNANSGSSASSLGGGTTTYAAAMAAHGSFGARFISTASNATYRRWLFAASTTTFQFSGVLTSPGTLTNALDVGTFIPANASRKLTIRIHESGEVRIVLGDNSHQTLVPAANMSAGTKLRITIQAVGGSTTTSSYTAKAYLESTPQVWTAQVGSTATRSNIDLGVDPIIGFEAGVLNAMPQATTVGWDDLQLRDGTGGEIGDYSATNNPPVANAGSHQFVQASSTVTLDGSGSTDPDENTLTYSWSFLWPASGAPTLSGATTASPTFTAGSAGAVYTLQLQVSDGAASNTATVNVAVVPLGGGGNANNELVWSGTSWQ